MMRTICQCDRCGLQVDAPTIAVQPSSAPGLIPLARVYPGSWISLDAGRYWVCSWPCAVEFAAAQVAFRDDDDE